MASSKLRSSSSLLLSTLNLLLLLLSTASLAPVLLLRYPPTLFGWTLLATSITTILSSLLCFYSHLCFITHITVSLASLSSQALGFLALLLRHDRSLRLLGSVRRKPEQRLLVKIEKWVLIGMFVVQLVVMLLACVVQISWVREYEGLEEAASRKRSRRTAQVQEESMVNAAAAAAEVKARELDDKIKSKYGQWAKIDLVEKA